MIRKSLVRSRSRNLGGGEQLSLSTSAILCFRHLRPASRRRLVTQFLRPPRTSQRPAKGLPRALRHRLLGKAQATHPGSTGITLVSAIAMPVFLNARYCLYSFFRSCFFLCAWMATHVFMLATSSGLVSQADDGIEPMAGQPPQQLR